MCIAYSGRCLLSSYLTGRSANSGNCTHSCRWEYRVLKNSVLANPVLQNLVLEERERPGEYFPVFQGEGFTSVLSSRDLCMIEHLDKMRDAGIGALKIEGRMKSLYYTALVTRAYRKGIDALEGKIPAEEAEPFIGELYNTSHRDFGTGFYFGREDADKTAHGAAAGRYEMAGIIGEELSGPMPGGEYSEKRYFEYISTNKTNSGAGLEYIGPHIISIADRDYRFLTPDTYEPMDWVSHGHPCVICTAKPVESGYIVRMRNGSAE
jgi:putative protease